MQLKRSNLLPAEKKIVYKAKVQIEGSARCRTYVGASENSFKTRYYSHKNYFRYSENRAKISLARHVWGLKETETRPFKISWGILDKAPAYKQGAYVCHTAHEMSLMPD